MKKRTAYTGLMLAALGVVFGDIGTSPLYAVQTIFGSSGLGLTIDPQNVYGIISLILWSILLIVSIKYLGFIMRVNNGGEGGILAQVALLRRSAIRGRSRLLFIVVGLIGVALFYGDGSVTPAISMLSAVEGLGVIAPDLERYVIPVTLVIIVGLFLLQRKGTGIIGRLFGPVMLVWFGTIAVAGLLQIIHTPGVLAALSPQYAFEFFARNPLLAFTAMGIVLLAITGAEAFYADMGHFGRPAIARAWFVLVFPALILCYMGQGALLLDTPDVASGLFFHMFAPELHIPIVILATAATIIASQSVISGAFSLTRQAIHLGVLPKFTIKHTSDQTEGQIYIPFVNYLMLGIVIFFVLAFGSATKLANIYGIAVSGTFIADALLFMALIRYHFQQPVWVALLFGLVFVPLDLLFVTSSLSKLQYGGWITLTITGLVLGVIYIWQRGQRILNRRRAREEGSLGDFIEQIHDGTQQPVRIPGTAVFIGHHPDKTPLALRSVVEDMHELPERSIVVYVTSSTEAHIDSANRAVFDGLKYDDGISELHLTYGYHDTPHIPRDLTRYQTLSPELHFDPSDASYFVSLTNAVPDSKKLRDRLYCVIANSSLNSGAYYRLPLDRTVEIHTSVKV